uniref:RNase H type-1 domain-containing protein n=1 Tax=Pygocentrus nattereri TaxID=42514 RepID=A0AAR2KTL3_PYGNA
MWHCLLPFVLHLPWAFLTTTSVAACALMIQDAEKIVLGHALTLHTSHQVCQLLNNCSTQQLSAQRRAGYENILLATENLSIHPHSALDSVSSGLMRLLSLSESHTSSSFDLHDCTSRLAAETSIRPDVLSTRLSSGLSFYVDGSCSKPSDGTFLCGYAVCSPPSTVVESFSLPFSSAQAAELYAITRACILSQDQDVTIYTDSRYAFGVVHDFGGIWSQRGFVTSDNKPISHALLIEDLIRASFLPSRLAVVKVHAHQRGSDPDSVGNNAADSAARPPAQPAPSCMLSRPCCVRK